MRTNPNTTANSNSLPEINPSDLEAVRDFLKTDRPASSPSHRPHHPESAPSRPHVPLSIGITRARNRAQPK